MSASTDSIRPKRMPMSRFARRFWLGSRSSPPLITRSYLSSGPIAARTALLSNPVAKAAPMPATKRRRSRKLISLSPLERPAGRIGERRAAVKRRRSSPPLQHLERLDVRRRRALLALRHVERDLLALFQRFEARALDRAVVGEQILAAAVGRDEAEALGVVEPLHRACSHCPSLYSKKSCVCARQSELRFGHDVQGRESTAARDAACGGERGGSSR